MTTDSILRSFYNVVTTTFVPFAQNIANAFDLLLGETQGYAINATNYDTATAALFVGGPVGGTVATIDTTTPANNLSNVPLDRSNLTQSGTSAKIVNWNTFSGPHNLARYSEDITNTNGWNADGGTDTSTANATTSPDGLTTADQWTQGNGKLICSPAMVTISGATHTASFYLKANTATWLRVTLTDNSGNGIDTWFNVSTGLAGSTIATGTSVSGGSSFTSVGSGWYRVWVSGTIPVASIYLAVAAVTADAVATRDAGKTFYVWGAQLNIGSLTDYVPTTAVCSGGVRWTPHNLVTQSQTLATTWTVVTSGTVTSNAATAPDNTLTAEQFNEGGTNSAHGIQQSLGPTRLPAGVLGTHSVYAKAGTRNFIYLAYRTNTSEWIAAGFNVSTGVLVGTNTAGSVTLLDTEIIAVGNGWYRISITGSCPNPDGDFVIGASNTGSVAGLNTDAQDVFAGTSSTLFIWGAQVNRGPVPTPYIITTTASIIGIPQGYDVTNSKFGILIEPAATNIQVESTILSAWTLDNITSVDTGFTAPDGSSDAAFVMENSANASHAIYNFVTVSNATVYTVSVYAKAGTRNWLKLNFAVSTDFRVWFNLATGAIGTITGGATATMTSVGGGWYRCTVTATSDAVSGAASIEMANADGANTYTGDGTSGLYAWGPQLELGSVATSYIPTVSATATRGIDQIKALIGTLPYSTTVGTVYADALCRDLSGLGIPWWFNDDGDTNVIKVNYDNSAGVVFYTEAAGVDQLGVSGLDIGNAVNNTRSQSTATWQANSFAGSVDGAAIATDISGSVGVGQTHLAIGADFVAGVRALNGFLYRFVYVPRRVTDGNLPTFRYNYP